MRREVAIAGHDLLTSSDDSQDGAGCSGHGEVSTFDETHPESTARLRAALAGITVRGLWPLLRQLPTRSASDAELELSHSRQHLRALERASDLAAKKGKPLFLPVHGQFSQALSVEQQLTSTWEVGRDTFVTGGSLRTARGAAGGMLSIIDAIFSPSSVRRGFCLARPPGHHAGWESSDGFCLVNNIAVAANYARHAHPDKVKRVLIFDWDVHHGQGTQDIFWSDPNALFISVHRREAGFYPQSGDVAETGEGEGRGYTVNVPLEAGYGDACLWLACFEVLLPAARRFQPDLILVSSGFDAVRGDPLGGCLLSSKGLGKVAAELCALAEELCEGRLVLALEGGYSEEVLRDGVGEVFDALVMPVDSSERARVSAPFSAPPDLLFAEPPLASSRAAVQAVRAAHKNLPLRLSDGYASKLLPFPAMRTLSPRPAQAWGSSKSGLDARSPCRFKVRSRSDHCGAWAMAETRDLSQSSAASEKTTAVSAFNSTSKTRSNSASASASTTASAASSSVSSSSSSSASCQSRNYRRLIPTGHAATTLLAAFHPTFVSQGVQAAAISAALGSEVPPAKRRRLGRSGSCGGGSDEDAKSKSTMICLSRSLWRSLSVKDQASLSALNVRLVRTVAVDTDFVVATSLRRTETLMCAICRGISVLTNEWLVRSLEAKRLLPVEGYELKDKAAEEKSGMFLSDALSRAKLRPFLLGYEVFLSARIVGELRRVAVQVVEAGGGFLVPTGHQPDTANQQLLIIDVGSRAPGAEQDAERQPWPRFALELLFQGALTQELSFDTHRIRCPS